MKKKKSDQLDHIVKDKLNQLRVEYNPQHWAQFEHLLDAEEAGVAIAENQAMDEVVFDKLHQIKAGAQVAHWDKLAARLDEQMDVRRNVLLHKLMEVSLILLLLLVVSQQFPTNTWDAAIASQPIATQEETQHPKLSPHRESDHSNNTTPNQAQLQTAATEEETNVTNDAYGVVNQSAASSFKVNAADEMVGRTAEAAAKKVASTSPTLPKSAMLKPKSIQEEISLKENINRTPADIQQVVPQRLELMNALEQIMLSELEYNGQPGYVELVSPIKPRSAWVVSMFGGGDYNQVITPKSVGEDQIYDKWLRYAPGYSGGITAGLDFGRWEIGGGAVYMAKKYEPRPIVYLGGSFFDPSYEGEGLRYIELNMVQLPLYFRYNFIYHDKWRAYTTMGFALQVNLQTNYYYADANAFDPSLPRPLPRPDQNYAPEQPLPGGWLDGGALWQNGYISGNVSIGLERYITGRWSIFTQPTYHHSLNYFTQGIGPDKDRINTMSIFAGVRVRLND